MIQKQEQMGQQLQMAKIQAEIMQHKLRAALDQAKAKALDAKTDYDKAKTMEVLQKISSMDTEQMIKMIELSMKVEKEGHFGVDPLNGGQPEQGSNVIPLRQKMNANELVTTR